MPLWEAELIKRIVKNSVRMQIGCKGQPGKWMYPILHYFINC